MVGNWEGLKTVFKFIDKNGNATISISDMKVRLLYKAERDLNSFELFVKHELNNLFFSFLCLGSFKYHEVSNVWRRQTWSVSKIWPTTKWKVGETTDKKRMRKKRYFMLESVQYSKWNWSSISKKIRALYTYYFFCYGIYRILTSCSCHFYL